MDKKYTAIVLAAGKGTRMGSKTHKQYLLLNDKPVLYYSLKAFQDSDIDEIILVTGKDEVSYCQKEIVDKYRLTKVVKTVEGGAERYDSVFCGLQAVENTDYVLIHDGARPFLDGQILERCKKAVQKDGACVVGMPTKDTIKIADEKGYAADTPRRDLVWNIQTPQCFTYPLIYNAYKEMMSKRAEYQNQNITDDAMVVEYFSKHPVKLVEGSYRNIKITTPEDLQIAQLFVEELKK